MLRRAQATQWPGCRVVFGCVRVLRLLITSRSSPKCALIPNYSNSVFSQPWPSLCKATDSLMLVRPQHSIRMSAVSTGPLRHLQHQVSTTPLEKTQMKQAGNVWLCVAGEDLYMFPLLGSLGICRSSHGNVYRIGIWTTRSWFAYKPITHRLRNWLAGVRWGSRTLCAGQRGARIRRGPLGFTALFAAHIRPRFLQFRSAS